MHYYPHWSHHHLPPLRLLILNSELRLSPVSFISFAFSALSLKASPSTTPVDSRVAWSLSLPLLPLIFPLPRPLLSRLYSLNPFKPFVSAFCSFFFLQNSFPLFFIRPLCHFSLVCHHTSRLPFSLSSFSTASLGEHLFFTFISLGNNSLHTEMKVHTHLYTLSISLLPLLHSHTTHLYNFICHTHDQLPGLQSRTYIRRNETL